jgi:valacyclovir hydrolase
MSRITIDGVNLYYEDRGQGFPLLCLPGGLGTGETDFGPQLDAWSSQFRVISPDLRGYGQSRPPERDFSGNFFERDAGDVVAFAKALGLDAYSLAGWSDGANTAALVAAAQPERVRKLVLWGGNSYVSAADAEGLERSRALSAWPKRRLQALEGVYGESLDSLWNAYCDSMRDLHLAGRDICGACLSQIRCPALVLHGELDPLISERHAQIFQEGIAGARLYLIRGGRHNIHLTHSDEFNKEMLPFLGE